MSAETQLPTAREATRRLKGMGGARTRDHDFSSGSVLARTLTNSSSRWPEHIHPQRVVAQPSTSHRVWHSGVSIASYWNLYIIICTRIYICDQKFSVLEGMCLTCSRGSSLYHAFGTFVCSHVWVTKQHSSHLRFTQDLHGATSQKMAFFIVTTGETSNLTNMLKVVSKSWDASV
jgi:hypothetical protein